ncbi:MAG: hypothetical protein HZA90_19585 [Verrucomicrobia bacterium]|nr:hypothetical protein [Verrucomicrobiota bacterium]
MKLRLWTRGLLLLALLAAAAFSGAGCKTHGEPENDASRPWNTPKSWEHGLPGGMWDRR